FDLERVTQAGIVLELNRFRIIELRLADDLEIVLLDGLLVAFGDEVSADVFANVAGEALLDQLLRRMPRPKTGNRSLLAKLFVLLAQLLFDPLFWDLDDDLLRGRAGILDADLVLIFLLLLIGGGVDRDGCVIVGHGYVPAVGWCKS